MICLRLKVILKPFGQNCKMRDARYFVGGPRYVPPLIGVYCISYGHHFCIHSLEMRKRRFSEKKKDVISDMPQNIKDTILTKLPIRDAVRTSILSTTWKYQWAHMTQLVFDKYCVPQPFTRETFINFMMHCLLLHDGPIHNFKLSSPGFSKSPGIDRCLRFVSRKDVKELDLHSEVEASDLPVLMGGSLSLAPSPLFSCQKITSLTLVGFDVRPPPNFRGFPCLKYLKVDYCMVTLKVIENLISGCPLLESFEFSNADQLALTLDAPNLKRLTVKGSFKDVYLKHTPLLAALSVDFFPMAWKGDAFVKLPITFTCLTFIEVDGVNYQDKNKVMYVHHLLLQSPNLQELHISAAPTGYGEFTAADLDLWDKEGLTDFKFMHLKIVKMSSVSNEHDKKFIKFVLGRSPVLQMMSISLDEDCIGKMGMVNELLHFQRASPNVDITFFD
ncbi:F-box/FBD/LRR-repeat protein [Heracleum sosnowskyi]|uniref:F-box/FBD/LRR-repeat protein n=1 Tax=Heracleum sosnowskyi TaxID=360622 RepID=A0AAD8MJL5_9APIA|nr:F-box/FBD/LRR-repeat protein [Heracleum sosnowskyi]